jgi:DNA processing protein
MTAELNRQNLPEEAFAAALASVPQVGPANLRRLLASDPPSVAWSRTPFPGDVARIWQRHEEEGIEVCWRGGPTYPARLEVDPEAPAVLFCVGDPATSDRHPTVALVGTRSPTRYGIGVAAQFGADLAALGVSVVSGLALGIDGAAHEGATAAGAPSAGAPPIAVVAGGLDDPYPRRHERLWARVAEQGAIYSESPAGVRTEKWRFPVRNRLLAMLSDVVVVVESRHRGGALYTVAAAAERDIPVGAVPGSIRSSSSEGTNRLLADGCFPVCSVADIVTALALKGVQLPAPPQGGSAFGPDGGGTGPGSSIRTGTETGTSANSITGADRALLDELSSDPVSLDHLVRVTGLELTALCGGLERLARLGVARDIGGWWERT